MGILKMKQVKQIVHENGKQATPAFYATLDRKINDQVVTKVQGSRSKRLTEADLI